MHDAQSGRRIQNVKIRMISTDILARCASISYAVLEYDRRERLNDGPLCASYIDRHFH